MYIYIRISEQGALVGVKRDLVLKPKQNAEALAHAQPRSLSPELMLGSKFGVKGKRFVISGSVL